MQTGTQHIYTSAILDIHIYTHLQYWTFYVIKVRTSWNKTMQTYITSTTAKWQINGPKKQEKLGQHRLKLCGK